MHKQVRPITIHHDEPIALSLIKELQSTIESFSSVNLFRTFTHESIFILFILLLLDWSLKENHTRFIIQNNFCGLVDSGNGSGAGSRDDYIGWRLVKWAGPQMFRIFLRRLWLVGRCPIETYYIWSWWRTHLLFREHSHLWTISRWSWPLELLVLTKLDWESCTHWNERILRSLRLWLLDSWEWDWWCTYFSIKLTGLYEFITLGHSALR